MADYIPGNENTATFVSVFSASFALACLYVSCMILNPFFFDSYVLILQLHVSIGENCPLSVEFWGMLLLHIGGN